MQTTAVTRRRVVEGAGLWLLVLVPLATLGPLGLRTLLLALAPLVLVPLALPLLSVPEPLERALQPAALLATTSLLLPAGTAAAVLALPYGLLVAALGLVGLRRLPDLLPAAALGWLAVGGGWLVLSRAGLRPLGYTDAVVELTAVHFHVAGLAATVLAACTVRAGGPRWAAVVVTLAPVVVAAGYVGPELLQLVGAVLLTVGLLRLSAWSWRHEPEALLRLSAASLWLTMPLAVWWSVGVVTDLPHLSLAQTAATHGVLNAVGFAAAGLAARSSEPPL